MSDTNIINVKKTSGRVIFFVVIALFLIGAFIFTKGSGADSFQEHDVVSDIDSFLYGLESLLYGDIEGFFEGIVAGIPVLAMFMILFALLHFLITVVLKSLFKSPRVGTALAFVISIYGFIDHRIFNYMLSLNAYAVGFLVFSALVIMLWGFAKHGKQGLSTEWKEGSTFRDASALDRDQIKQFKELMQNIGKDTKK